MKPTTKTQVKIFALSQSLPKITATQKKWALKHTLKHVGYRTKKSIGCLDCGHIWNGPKVVTTCVCPACKAKLTIEDTTKKLMRQEKRYLSILDVVDGYQVVRILEISSTHRVGEKANAWVWEVVQQFFNTENKMEVVARGLGTLGNPDCFWGYLENRRINTKWHNKYDMWTDFTYPKMKVLPIYERNGYTYPTSGISHYLIFNNITTESKAETLLKARHEPFLAAFVGNGHSRVYRHWQSVKICLRNNYIPTERAKDYFDYLDLLNYFGKDLTNAHYVCPADLKAEHDRLVAKKMEVIKQREEQEKRRTALLNQKQYERAKKAFFGLMFTSGSLTIKVLETVQEFIDEANAHKHCVFSNEYFKKDNSLILSARIDGELIETIELSLPDLKIVQSRGRGNTATEHNKKIIKLVKSNLPVIQKRLKSA